MNTVWRVLVGVALVAAALPAQTVISARSGLIHYIEGTVYVGDQKVESKFGNFPEVGQNAVLRTTAEGRAEVLLTPGVFLRVGEQSSFRMLENRLTDTRLEFLSGSAEIEADDLPKDNGVTVVYKDFTMSLVKKGLYRLDSYPAALHVFDGEMTVAYQGKTIEVKQGKMLAFEAPLAIAKFDKDNYDSLDRWSRQRGAMVAMANVSAANSIRQSGMGWTGGWAWNPYFGMFTFIPADGYLMNYWGYNFWSPGAVYSIYRPAFLGGGGRSTGVIGSRPGQAAYSALPASTSSHAAMQPARSSSGRSSSGISMGPPSAAPSAPSSGGGGLRSGGAPAGGSRR